MTYKQAEDRTTLWKGIVAGALGGLAGSFVMNQFQAGLSAASKAISNGGEEPQSESESSEESDDATVKTARAIAENVLHKPLPKSEKQAAGSAVHYAFGATVGAVYGACSAALPITTLGRGIAYGTAVFLLADEVGVPAARLAPPPTESPASSHAKAFASHCVYGFVTDLVRRSLLKMG